MTDLEQNTIQRYQELVNSYWLKYCQSKSPFMYSKWEEKKKKLDAYLTKIQDKYRIIINHK